MQVQNPDDQQKADTKWRDGKVFVVYYGTGEVQALPTAKVERWGKRPVPGQTKSNYGAALQQAVRAVKGGASV